MKDLRLNLIVFISGASVMIMELVGSRVFAPYLGTSLFIWTSLIGIILASLSAGYYLGGHIADKKPTYKAFSTVLFLSAIAVGVMTLVRTPILEFASQRIDDVRVGSTLAAIIIFSPGSVLLGMVSPYAVRLKMHDVKHSGATVGTLYALSTLGSITGTFLAGFYLIPTFGNTTILYMLVVTLVLLSIFACAKKIPFFKISFIAAFIFAFYSSEAIFASHFPEGLIDVDTSYNRVWIYDEIDGRTGRPMRKMALNKSSSSAMFLDNMDELAYPYANFYNLAHHFKPDLDNTLMLGGAAYTYPRFYLQEYPEATMTVVEIDPGLAELAHEHFDLPRDPRMTIVHEDARTFLNTNEEKFDVVYGDAYKSLYFVPHHLTTIEAIQHVYKSLEDDGIFMVNVISAIEGETGQFLRAELATIKEVFPQAYVFPVQAPGHGEIIQNNVIVAFKSPERQRMVSDDFQTQQWLSHRWREEIPMDMDILTDEFAPVDDYVNKMLDSI